MSYVRALMGVRWKVAKCRCWYRHEGRVRRRSRCRCKWKGLRYIRTEIALKCKRTVEMERPCGNIEKVKNWDHGIRHALGWKRRHIIRCRWQYCEHQLGEDWCEEKVHRGLWRAQMEKWEERKRGSGNNKRYKAGSWSLQGGDAGACIFMYCVMCRGSFLFKEVLFWCCLMASVRRRLNAMYILYASTVYAWPCTVHTCGWWHMYTFCFKVSVTGFERSKLKNSENFKKKLLRKQCLKIIS